MKLLLIPAILLAGCASAPRDYHDASPAPEMARLYVYRPHQLESQWAKYEISVQGKPVRILGDEGYFALDVPPGTLNLRSHHVQDKLVVVGLDLEAHAGQSLFVKLDPDAEKFSLLGALGDVLAISSVVAGEKARFRLENGQGSLGDVVKMGEGESAKQDLASKRPLGYHLLLSMQEAAGRKELGECCSSGNTEEVAK